MPLVTSTHIYSCLSRCNGCLKCVQKTFTVLFEFTYVRQMIYGDDRLLVVQSEDTDELKMLLLDFPVMFLHHILDRLFSSDVSYISQNWPVQHVAASKDGMYLAVASLHGGECLETLLRNKRFSAKVCYGWGRLLLSATTLILLTREIPTHISIPSDSFYLQQCHSLIWWLNA
ncbi:unnamed protein product [Malus baccata var. baccata]